MAVEYEWEMGNDGNSVKLLIDMLLTFAVSIHLVWLKEMNWRGVWYAVLQSSGPLGTPLWVPEIDSDALMFLAHWLPRIAFNSSIPSGKLT